MGGFHSNKRVHVVDSLDAGFGDKLISIQQSYSLLKCMQQVKLPLILTIQMLQWLKFEKLDNLIIIPTKYTRVIVQYIVYFLIYLCFM